MDSLNNHPVPETSEAIAILGNVKDNYCLDAVKCRLNALTKRTRGLPVFCPLDDWEPFQLAKLPEYDFVFIDLGARVHIDTFPYTGSRPYAAEVCEWLLDKKIISACHCKFGLRASARVLDFERCVRKFEEMAEGLVFESLGGDLERQRWIKRGLLSMIGLWNSTVQNSYKLCYSKYQVDAGNGVVRRRQLPEGMFEFTTARELIDLYSMAPWGRIALDVEQMRIAQAMDTLQPF